MLFDIFSKFFSQGYFGEICGFFAKKLKNIANTYLFFARLVL